MTGLHRATFSSHTDELLVVCVPFNSKKEVASPCGDFEHFTRGFEPTSANSY